MSGLFKNASAIRIAVRCSQDERTMLSALEIVAVSARLTRDEGKKEEKIRLLADLISFHGDCFGFGAALEAEDFIVSLVAENMREGLIKALEAKLAN